MFGYWKREAKKWEAKYRLAAYEHVRAHAGWKGSYELRLEALASLEASDDELRRTKAELSAADLQLAAEKQDNERLGAEVAKLESMNERIEERLTKKLKAAQAGLDHAAHCYEQCEADRQSLARERNAAKAKLSALQSAYDHLKSSVADVIAHASESYDVIREALVQPETTETASARPDPADHFDAHPDSQAYAASERPGRPGCPGRIRCILWPAYDPDTDADGA